MGGGGAGGVSSGGGEPTVPEGVLITTPMNIASSSVSTTTNQNRTSPYTAAWLTGASWPAGPACWCLAPRSLGRTCPIPGSNGLDGCYPLAAWPNWPPLFSADWQLSGSADCSWCELGFRVAA